MKIMYTEKFLNIKKNQMEKLINFYFNITSINHLLQY